MSKRCEQLRAQALAGGMDSKAGLAWRIHCKSCEDCRTELFILESLHRQATDEHRHLPRTEVARLLREVRVQGRMRRQQNVWQFAAKAACVALVALGAFLIHANQSPRPFGSSPSLATGRPGLSPAAGGEGDGGALRQLSKVAASLLGKNEPASQPELPASQTIDRQLAGLRREVAERRQELLGLYSEELDDIYWLHSDSPEF